MFDYGFVIFLKDIGDKVLFRDLVNSFSFISLLSVIYIRFFTFDKLVL